MSLTVYIGSDNVLTLDVVDAIGGSGLASKTATVTLTNSAGTEVSGETWPLSLSYVGTTTTAMDGTAYTDVSGASQTRYRYRVTLADTLSLSAQAKYSAAISFNGGAGLQRDWVVAVVAKTGTDVN